MKRLMKPLNDYKDKDSTRLNIMVNDTKRNIIVATIYIGFICDGYLVDSIMTLGNSDYSANYFSEELNESQVGLRNLLSDTVEPKPLRQGLPRLDYRGNK